MLTSEGRANLPMDPRASSIPGLQPRQSKDPHVGVLQGHRLDTFAESLLTQREASGSSMIIISHPAVRAQIAWISGKKKHNRGSGRKKGRDR